jgi:WD40 repeat protein
MSHPWCSLFLPGGKQLLTGGDDGRVHFWDVKTGREVRSFRVNDIYLLALALSPNGKTLAVAGESNKAVTLWDLQTGRRLHRLVGHPQTVYSVHFSPDGKLLASGCMGHEVRVWDVRSGKQLQNLPHPAGQSNYIHATVFSPDGKTLAVGGTTNDIALWDTTTWKRTRTLKGHTDRVINLAWSPDSRRLYSGSYDKTARVWDARPGKELRRLETPEYVGDIALSPDGKTLAAGLTDSGNVLAWDTATGKRLWAAGEDDCAMGLSFSPDGKALASLSRSSITIRDAHTGKLLLGPEGPKGFVRELAFSPDGRRLMAAAHGGEVAAWDTASMRRVFLARLQGPHVPWHTPILVRFTARDRALAAVSDQVAGTVSLLSLPGKRRVGKPVKGHTTLAVIASDGQSLIQVGEEGLGRYSVLGGKAAPLYLPLGQSVRSLHLSRDGRVLLASGGAGQLMVWDVRTGQLRLRTPKMERPARAAFAANGHLALTALSGRPGRGRCLFTVWETATGTARQQFDGPADDLGTVALSPDGRLLVVGTAGQGTQLWSVPEGKRLATLREARSALATEFSPDGRVLATGGIDGTVLLWDMPGLLAPRRLPAPLSAAQLARVWEQLGKEDGGKAVWKLADHPGQAVALFREKFKRERAWAAKLSRLIAKVMRGGADRRKAASELAAMGRLPLPAIHEALAGKLELEQRDALEALARRLGESSKEAVERRVYRALEILDSLRTPEAIRLRAELAFDRARVEEP